MEDIKRCTPYRTPFPMEHIPEPVFPTQDVNSASFSSIQEAVDRCAGLGGGTVRVPAGRWESGAVHLRSNIRLHLEKGAVVSFSSRPEDYLPPVFTRWEGMECYNYSPLIYAEGCENVAVTGEGTLLGNGSAWWHWKKLQQAAADRLCGSEADGIPVQNRVYGTEEAALRPSFLQFIHCRGVLLDGVTVLDGPQWTLHPVYCENVIVRNVHVHTEGPNTDGLNPDSCRNVLIEDCDFYTGDDCIALNSGMNEDGWRVNRPCENILIRRCRMTGGHGGLVIGSAVSGGVRNVYAHDCEISDTMQGIRLKSMRGRGGYVEHVLFEDIRVDGITNECVTISMFYPFSTVVPRSKAPSDFRDITIRRVSGTGLKTGIELRGLPEKKLSGVRLQDIRLSAPNAFVCEEVEGLVMDGVEIG
ncbi:MAG TPA: glycoside hydrolase family 28 protein [Candidatus Eisenbergiella merdavium]|uniref:Glycoside hydrolase family 28 protein n=1 Tax=Candidatus Eisenbergiella merdavium TaxID=2838551 RepID=A0A9D2NF86_9FIRM|nr:glycoside hydrolase family 28 protein [Candidatus Eisenbergiella merdavium]